MLCFYIPLILRAKCYPSPRSVLLPILPVCTISFGTAEAVPLTKHICSASMNHPLHAQSQSSMVSVANAFLCCETCTDIYSLHIPQRDFLPREPHNHFCSCRHHRSRDRGLLARQTASHRLHTQTSTLCTFDNRPHRSTAEVRHCNLTRRIYNYYTVRLS